MMYRREEAVGTCARRGEPCLLKTVGFSWKQTDPDVYERYMIRKCIVCGDRNAELVHYLDISLPFCTHCGSQHFSGPPTEDKLILTCAECGNEQSVCIEESLNGGV